MLSELITVRDVENLMKLTKLERLSLCNQFLILEKLYPEYADGYEQHRKAVQNGYALNYDWIMEHMYDEMSEQECKEVLDILEMYRSITFSYERLSEKESINTGFLKFPGFDGNNESGQMGYAMYFIIDLGRYEELKYGKEFPDLNSHRPTLEKYRSMLEEWKNCSNQNELGYSDIKRILEAEV